MRRLLALSLCLVLASSSACSILISALPNITSLNLPTYLTSQSCSYVDVNILSISDINLGTLSLSTFSSLTKLESISINNCGLNVLPNNLFAGLSSLTYLSLSNNLLSTLSVNTFVGMNSNNQTPLLIDLSNNQLSSLVSGLFATCNSLKYLYITNNQLVSLEADVFTGAPLDTLDLSYNNLTGFVSNTFQGLTKLDRLSLNNNDLVPSGFQASLLLDSLLLSWINLKNNPRLLSLPTLIFGPSVAPLTALMDPPLSCQLTDSLCSPCRLGSLTCYYTMTSPIGSPSLGPSRFPSTTFPTSATPTTRFPTTFAPTTQPTFTPTTYPTFSPTAYPTGSPTTVQPTFLPTINTPVTLSPTTNEPTLTPSSTLSPSTILPSSQIPANTVSPTSLSPVSTSDPISIPSSSPSFSPTPRPSNYSLIVPPTVFSGAQTGGAILTDSGSNLSISIGLPVVAVFFVAGLVMFCLCYRRKLTIDGRILVHLQNEVAIGPGSRAGSIEFRDASLKHTPVDLKIVIPYIHPPVSHYSASSVSQFDDTSILVGDVPEMSPSSCSSINSDLVGRQSPLAPSSPAPRLPAMTEIPSMEVEVGAPLGNGAFGSVHQCLWRGTDYALKRLLNPDQGALFEKEVEVNRQLACLPHIYVTRMVGFISNPTAGIVMELYPMGNVEDFLRTNLLGKDDFAQLLTVLINASAGVMHLHSLGIIHRDLAARNFLIKQDLSAAVCDFGLAMPLPEGKSKGQRTPAERQTDMLPVNVAAPETLEEGIYSTASDVYMFGLFIWEVLARQTPHSDRPEFTLEHKDFKGFIHKVIHEDLRPVLPLEWPSGLRMLLAQCWHRNPGSRPTMMHVNDTLRLCRKEILANHTPLPRRQAQRLPVDQGAYYSPAGKSADEVVPPNEDGSGRKKNPPPPHSLADMDDRSFSLPCRTPSDMSNKNLYDYGQKDGSHSVKNLYGYGPQSDPSMHSVTRGGGSERINGLYEVGIQSDFSA